ncbi:hypothetical protein EVB91_113 [Rhizobium phage RHph_I1_18]|nr:hypothetical protein EVB91_113 [Rhizobium phage RHph_I1_18]
MIYSYIGLGYIFFVANMILNGNLNVYMKEAYDVQTENGNVSRKIGFAMIIITAIWPILGVLQMLSITKTLFKR